MFKKHKEVIEPEYFTTKDGRRVQYLENPLPVPKKHVAHTMSFDVDEVFTSKSMTEIKSNNGLEFDVDIADGDDFDV